MTDKMVAIIFETVSAGGLARLEMVLAPGVILFGVLVDIVGVFLTFNGKSG